MAPSSWPEFDLFAAARSLNDGRGFRVEPIASLDSVHDPGMPVPVVVVHQSHRLFVSRGSRCNLDEIVHRCRLLVGREIVAGHCAVAIRCGELGRHHVDPVASCQTSTSGVPRCARVKPATRVNFVEWISALRRDEMRSIGSMPGMARNGPDLPIHDQACAGYS